MTCLTSLRAGALLGVLVLAVACGTAVPPTPAGGTPAGGTPGPTAAGGATPTAQPDQPGAGHDLQDPCGLITVQELSAALGVTVVDTEETVGEPPTYCNYRTADGTSVLATSYSVDPINTAVFSSFAGAEGAVRVPGIADDAVISGGALYVKQGDAMVGIQPSSSVLRELELDEQQVTALLTAVGQAVAGRL